MWKCVNKNWRNPCERSANHFDKRCAAGAVNSGNGAEDKWKRHCVPPSQWFGSRRCWGSRDNTNNNNKWWNFDSLNRTWIGAITWSGALALGWYTSHIIHLKLKYYHWYNNKGDVNFKQQMPEYKTGCSITNFLNATQPKKNVTNFTSNLEKIIENFTPRVYFVSNDKKDASIASSEYTSSDNSTSSSLDKSDDALSDVLNSIENRLGLAAIENGQHQEGLSLLRSAANRKHAPALYNLGLCYEMGLGVAVNEKTAMELYRSAAALEHPGAMYNLGIYYGQGRGGLTRDLNTATRLLKLAAHQGQQDAIDALKSLNVDQAETHHRELNTWSYGCFPLDQPEHNILSSHTTLFVENVNYLQSRPAEATAY